MVPVFKNVEEKCTAKNYHSVGLLSKVIEVFQKLVNNREITIIRDNHLEKCELILIPCMVLGLLNQLQIC